MAAVLVEEDQSVKAGAVLLRLEDASARLRVQEAQADLQAARAQLVEARKLPRQHQARLAQMQAAIAGAKVRLAAARHVCEGKEALFASQLLQKADLDVARDQVKEAEALLHGELEKQAELQLHDPAADVCRAEEEVKAREARLLQAQESLRECAAARRRTARSSASWPARERC